MITRFVSLSSRLAAIFAVLFTIAACGGGGGGGSFLPEDESDNKYYVALATYDANGNPTSTVTSTTPARLEVTITKNNSKGAPIASIVVSAATNSGIGVITPATSVTNSQGVAVFQLEAGDTLGGDTITATVEGPTGTNEGTLPFQVEVADLRLGYFDRSEFVEGAIKLNATSLPSGGSAILSMTVVDESDNIVIAEKEITLNSPCIQSGLATITTPVTTINGQATATYTATGCDGSDKITASLVGHTSQATASLSVAPSTLAAVNFVSADPTNIALKGTGGAGRQETSTVIFQVVDGSGNPKSGVKVDFRLSTNMGGLKLNNKSASTDGTGQASTVVIAGNVTTTVRVEATITTEDGNGDPLSLTNISDILVVSSGLPDQDSFSLSAETLKIANAQEMDGIEVIMTVRMADKYNNPVPDGTAASFTTEYGAIGDSCVTTAGSCEVTWTSQSPRFPEEYADQVRSIFEPGYNCPSHSGSSGPCPDDLGYIRGMRSTILVTAIGEEYFIDANANGLYDEGEIFTNLPEAFIDNNEDGIYTPAKPACTDTDDDSSLQCKAGITEEFVDFNNNGVYDINRNAMHPDGLYNGLLCPQEGDGIWCSRELVNVRDSLVLTLATDINLYAILVEGGRVRSRTEEGLSYKIFISDQFNNSPPAGSTVTLSADGTGNTSDNVDDCEIVGETSFTVPDNTSRGAFTVPLQTTGRGTVTIEAGDFSDTFGCNAPEPPPEEEDGEGLSTGG